MGEQQWDTESLFENLVTYDSYERPFIDKYAQFGVTFESGRALGPGMAQVRSAALTAQVTCETMRLWLDEEGCLVSVPRNELRCFPWCVYETAHVGETLGIQARHVYLDERALLTCCTFTNEGEAPLTVSPVWLGQMSGDRFRALTAGKNFGYAELPLRETWARCGEGAVYGGLRGIKGSDILPMPAVRIVSASHDGVEAALSRQPMWLQSTEETPSSLGGVMGEAIFYSLRPQPLHIEPRLRRDIMFVMELSVATSLDPMYHFRRLDPAEFDIEAAIDEAKEDFERRVSVSSPPPCSAKHAALQRKIWRSRWALLRTGYRAHGKAGEYGDGLASTCVSNCGGFTRVFFWDSLFTSTAIAKFEPELAKGAIKSVFARQTESGYCPEHGFNYHLPQRSVIGAPQAPVAAWAVTRYLAEHPDDIIFLGSVYPLLVRNHAYWTDRADRDRDGLAEWTWSGQTADDSPLFDAYRSGSGCGWLPPVASVQLNSFLYRDACILAGLAEKVGDVEQAEAYRQSAAARAEALMRICFVEREKRFWDFNHATGRHARIKTFYLFWPIWSGMEIPDDVKKDLIENVLLNENEFFGAVPFPSVAYDEPSYEPTGYWRGRAWPHISYWLLEMLVREGYPDAAREAGRRITAAYLREAGFPENLATDPGLYDAAGQPDYNWGAAGVYLIATEEYLRSASVGYEGPAQEGPSKQGKASEPSAS